MIRKAEIKDLPILAELACQLWPDHTVEEMRTEFAEILAKPDAAYFLAYAEETAIGFAQCQLRYLPLHEPAGRENRSVVLPLDENCTAVNKEKTVSSSGD